MRGEARVHIQAPPEDVYALVSDVTRTGEWSPECRRAEWLGGATGPGVGARFRGHNRRGPVGWTTTATVTAAEPGREFTFENGRTRWSYRLAPAAGGGTDLVESYELHRPPPRLVRFLATRLVPVMRRREADLQRNVQQTLERIKAIAEGTRGAR